ADEVSNARDMARHGQAAQALDQIFTKIASTVDGLHRRSMSPLQQATTDLTGAWNKLMDRLADSEPVKKAGAALTGLLNSLTNIVSDNSALAKFLGLIGNVASIVPGGAGIGALANAAGALVPPAQSAAGASASIPGAGGYASNFSIGPRAQVTGNVI